MRSFCYVVCIAFFVSVNRVYGSETGMPQLNPEFWIAQIFWLLLIFSSLYLIIWKIFLPKITYSLENRKSKVVNDLNETQKLKDSAEKKLNEYNKIIENSKKEAKKIIEENKKKLNVNIENKKQKLNEEIEKELITAEKEIKDLRNSSISNISKIACETSIEVIKQIVDTDVNRSSVSAIVDSIIKKGIEKRT